MRTLVPYFLVALFCGCVDNSDEQPIVKTPGSDSASARPFAPAPLQNPTEMLVRRLAAAMAEDQNAELIGVKTAATQKVENELVGLGTDALPWLLEHIDDSDSAGFSELVAVGMLGALSVRAATEVEGPDDARIKTHEGMNAYTRERESMITYDTSGKVQRVVYKVAIGDICFRILGRIVGCDYRTLRSVPSGVGIIASPVHQQWLAQGLREAWDPALPSEK